MSKQNPSAQFELAPQLAGEMRSVIRRLKQRLREHGADGDLTPSQVSVVLQLEAVGSTTVSDLARKEGMRPQSMSAVVASLQELGLVKGAPDPHDGRQTRISLTSKCLKLLHEGRTARQDWLANRISQKLSIEEQKELQAALSLFTRLVED